MNAHYKVAIVGSGPAGLSAAGHAATLDRGAAREQPSYILLEAFEHLSKTIYRYQKAKHVMAEPGYLKLRSDLSFEAGQRETILDNWNANVSAAALNLRLNSEVTKITGSKGKFQLGLTDGTTVAAENIVFALGLEGNPRKLGTPGDTPESVQYQLDDPEEYSGEDIIVVGAGDAAIENALALSAQNQVTILNRRDEFARVKDANQVLILKAISSPDQTLDCRYSTSVAKIETVNGGDKRLLVSLKTPAGVEELHVDRIVARLGAIPPRGFMDSCGIEFPHELPTALPELSEQYESNVPGLYIIGSLAGYPLIKQAMNQGYDVVEFINGNPIEPADNELLAYQFHGLPYMREVDELLKLMMVRIPMFRQLNALAFRELVIESRIYASYPDHSAAEEAATKIAKLKRKIATEYASEKDRPGTTEIVEEGQVLYEEGDRGVSFFTVLDGEAILESPRIPGGRRVLKQGEFFGEMSLIAGQPRRESSRVGRNCVLMETPRRTILKLMNSNDVVRQGIVWIFTVRELQRHFAPTATVAELRPIASEIKQRSFAPGEVLWRAGDPGDSVHIVQNGTVALYRPSEEGDVVVAQIRAGELVGQMSVLGDPTHDQTAIASVFTETLEVTQEMFQRLMSLDRDQLETVRETTTAGLVSRAAWEVRPESVGLLNFMLEDGLGEATNALIINETLCIGCDNCEKACAETHGGISRLDRRSGATFASIHVPNACRHCQQPHCMKDCPPNAINRSSTGEVFIDDTCIGCGNCEVNCPYDAIKMEYEAQPKPGLFSWLLLGTGPGPGEESGCQNAKGGIKRAVKCDACMNLDSGPACVNACPTGAAYRISPDPISEIIKRSN